MTGSAVAGIDRWRGGWVIAEAADSGLVVWASQTIDEVCERVAGYEAVAIDMPIALAANGTRSAEAEVRAVLGSSARSVFTSPTRAAVEAESQKQATELNRAHGGPGISAQAYGLFASIRELRNALGGEGFGHWWETHPETTFAVMNGGPPLASKRSARGVGERLVLLEQHFPAVQKCLVESPPKVPVDDVLDAVAALWSARRIAAGTATVFGSRERDDEGFALGIRV